MKILRRITPFLLIAAIGVAAHAQEPEAPARSLSAGPFAMKTAPVDELSNLCPKGALLFARLNKPQAWLKEFAALMDAIQPGGGGNEDILGELGKEMGNPDLTGMDTGKPIGFALLMAEKGPMPVVMLPLSDQAAFKEKVGPSARHIYAGNYVIWSEDEDVAAAARPGTEPTRLGTSPMYGDFALAVDMDVARPLLEPLFEQMDQFVEMIRQMAGGPAGDLYAGLGVQMKTVLTDADQVGMAMNWREGVMEVAFRYSAKDGTKTAKDIAAEKITSKSLLGLINRTGFMTMDMRTSGESMWNSFGMIYESMLKDAPEALAALKKSFSLMQGMAFGMSFEGGMNGVSVMKISDEAEYAKILDEMPKLMTSMVDAYKKMMPPEMDFPIDMKLSVGTVWEHAGVKVRPYSMKMTVLESDQMPPEAIAAMKEMFAAMFGGESMEFQYAIVNGHVVGTIGPKAAPEIRGLIERVKAGDFGTWSKDLVELTKGFPRETTSLFSMDFAGVIRLVSGLEGIPLDDAMREKLRAAPSGLGFSGFSTNDGKHAGIGMRIDLMKIIRFAKSFE